MHIGQCCPTLSVEALKMAVQEAKRGDDLDRYRNAWQVIKEAAPDQDEAKFDSEWVIEKEESNKKELARLEAELKGYKNNLIKESIRVCLPRGLLPWPCSLGRSTDESHANK